MGSWLAAIDPPCQGGVDARRAPAVADEAEIDARVPRDPRLVVESREANTAVLGDQGSSGVPDQSATDLPPAEGPQPPPVLGEADEGGTSPIEPGPAQAWGCPGLTDRADGSVRLPAR